MACLVLILYYFLSTCLVIFIFYKFFCTATAYIGKSSNAPLFINDYFCNLPFAALLLLRSGDVETNPGPKKLSVIKFCHWNLNSIADYFLNRRFYYHSQLTQIICLSETFLDFTLYQHDENVMISGYWLSRADHSSNSKRGEACLYFKEHLPLIWRNDLSILQEC